MEQLQQATEQAALGVTTAAAGADGALKGQLFGISSRLFAAAVAARELLQKYDPAARTPAAAGAPVLQASAPAIGVASKQEGVQMQEQVVPLQQQQQHAAEGELCGGCTQTLLPCLHVTSHKMRQRAAVQP
jgi:hypothetical protein